MDKVREEFEKAFDYLDLTWNPDWERYRDESTQSFWLGFEKAHTLYTKETEPLKWRWEGRQLKVGDLTVAQIDYDDQWYGEIFTLAAHDDLCFEDEESARKWCEDGVSAFLAKLRGEA